MPLAEQFVMMSVGVYVDIVKRCPQLPSASAVVKWTRPAIKCRHVIQRFLASLTMMDLRLFV